MKNRKTRSAMRRMLFTLALVLVVAVASVGGTIAWLKASTDPVINTFTVGDINIDLYETKNSDGTETTNATTGKANHVTDWSAKLIPGSSYYKNPVVVVEQGSEPCWLFVKIEDNTQIGNTGGFIQYSNLLSTDTEWSRGNGVEGGIPTNVWYKTVDASEEEKRFSLLGNVNNSEKQIYINPRLKSI